MNYVARMEKVEAFGDIRQLVTRSVWGEDDSRGIYKTEPVYAGMFFDVLRQVSAGHPL